MSRKQRKYEKEIRARKAAEEKVEAEEKAKAERKAAAQQRQKAEEQRRAALSPEERASEDKFNGIIAFVVVAIIVVVVLVSCDFGGDDESDSTPAETTTTEVDTFVVNEIEARTQCQDLVEQQLKAPKTADFPWLDGDWKYTPVDGGYMVESYVDAENSFGAQIRSYFGCTVTKLDENNVHRTLDYFNAG